MADSELRTVIHVGLSPLEAQLITWSLAMAGAIADGDTNAQLTMALKIHTLVNDMRGGEYNTLVTRFDRLIKAAIPDAIFINEQCTHCACLDSMCCWCGRAKP